MDDQNPKITTQLPTKTSYPHLFSARSIGAVRLKNRIALAPMTRTSATADGRATKKMAQYYESFARGGFGLVITEGTYTDEARSQGYAHQPGIANEAQASAWREIADAVHTAGAPIFVQLMHAGALAQANRFRNGTIAPSAIKPRGQQLALYGGSDDYSTPREITPREIKEVIEGFASAAARAREAGFDGIELHGANGYLIDQFLTDYINHRTDEYGGPTRNRVRFAVEVLQYVRRAVGPSYPVGIRISQSKVNDPSHQWEGGEADATVIFQSLAESGADFIHVTGRDVTEPAFASGATLAAAAKRHGGVLVIANGKLEEPRRAEALLEAQEADIVSLARSALANTDWPDRAAHGRPLEPFNYAMLQPRATLDNADQWLKSAQVASSGERR
jgi:2,4-dienoyl-CoA reductase-like NADH-dependent reductase (Old Yellow Enzyme family)